MFKLSLKIITHQAINEVEMLITGAVTGGGGYPLWDFSIELLLIFNKFIIAKIAS